MLLAFFAVLAVGHSARVKDANDASTLKMLVEKNRVAKLTKGVEQGSLGYMHVPHGHNPHNHYNIGHSCAVNSQCKSGKCRLFKCAEDCKSGLERCYCDSNSTKCNECCSYNPYCWRAGLNAHKTCNSSPWVEYKKWSGDVYAKVWDGSTLEFDWRKNRRHCVGPIESQGTCGSCWAFAAATTATYRMCTPDEPFSQMDILCSKFPNSPCDGGYNDDGLNLLANSGGLSEAAFKYPEGGEVSSSNCVGYSSGGTRPAGTRRRLVRGEHYYVDAYVDDYDGPFRKMQSDEEDFNDKIKYELKNFGPVAVKLQLYNDWEFQLSDVACSAAGGGKPMSRVHEKSCCWTKRGGIFSNSADRDWCDESKEIGVVRGHAMVITGWGVYRDALGENPTDFWQIQNSYGGDWKWGGTMRLNMDYRGKSDPASDFVATVSVPKVWKPGLPDSDFKCWEPCGKKSGSCNKCGTHGKCCRSDGKWSGDNDCRNESGYSGRHGCVVGTGKHGGLGATCVGHEDCKAEYQCYISKKCCKKAPVGAGWHCSSSG